MNELPLPSFLEEESEEEILQRMLDAMGNDLDKSEGTFIWDTMAPLSPELAKTAEWCRQVLQRGFVSTTFGVYLDHKASERGLTRQDAVKATGETKLSGEPGTIIPAGTRVATPADNITPSIEFETTEELSIDTDGEVNIGIQAVNAGRSGNVKPYSISILVTNLDGVTAVQNSTGTSGGFDIESDESLRKRILEDNQKADGAGNISDYVTWAQQIASVGTVLVDSLWDGANTVRLIIFDRNNNPASPEVVQEVQTHIDPTQDGAGLGEAPIGAIVTVVTVDPFVVDVNIPALQPTDNYSLSQVKGNVEEALDQHFNQLDPGAVIRVKGVAAAIIQAEGVLDFGDITLNGSLENITLSRTDSASLGSVSYT
ncbi:baseplate J/gp47 family protein [Halobacillus litoralis]|uniref:Baseplate J family protein n=1 Tax=Halobacillus litoralis TaxID=45668 RepID=A0A410MCA6_9BACI|nr:baseplate J/gp47 family protein [Halobacillus litoralis]QAS52369.1 baseplate J family protein [Halobacillus litoralis]